MVLWQSPMESLVVMSGQVDAGFWAGKKVFLTGHSGFKGGWLALWLHSMGAKVYGYALSPNTAPALYNELNINQLIEKSEIADIVDFSVLKQALIKFSPDIVIHMAAQPLVRYSYENPIETYQVNVMGTVNLLESLRCVSGVRSTVIVTTDKCYENIEQIQGYSEEDPMGGHDPYSSSKGCAELVTAAYRKSFFDNDQNSNAIATARAGNVIGGGDWSLDRLVSDAIKAFESGQPLILRNPKAIRPWQHVLEPLSGYLVLAQNLYQHGRKYATAWNFGPNDEDAINVGEVANLLVDRWGGSSHWVQDERFQPHEANLLRLDCKKARLELEWSPKWNLTYAIAKTVDWYQALAKCENMTDFSLRQIADYQNT